MSLGNKDKLNVDTAARIPGLSVKRRWRDCTIAVSSFCLAEMNDRSSPVKWPGSASTACQSFRPFLEIKFYN